MHTEIVPRPHIYVAPMIILAFVLLVSFRKSSVEGTIIASSKLERCVNDGSVDQESLQCTEKMIVTLAIEGGRILDTERLEFDLTCVGSSVCPCPCDYASNQSCECRDLDQKLSINLEKSPVFATYPLTYIQSFNGRPKEVVHSKLSQCKAGEHENSPTCGWSYTGGQKVVDSQGFCCECSSGQVLTDTFGTLKEKTRANLNCDFFDNAWNPFQSNPSSAHCLYLDPLWFEAFEMSSAQIDFQIKVNMQNDAADSGAPRNNATSEVDSEQLLLSPAEPHKLSETRTVEAELLGDLAGYNELPSMSNKMLMIPFPAGSDPPTALATNKDQWMLIDKTEISLDGQECNKVGTSFTAFRYQSGGCQKPVGSCLSNQLLDRYEKDLNRTRDGLTPLHLLGRYTGNPAVRQAPSSAGAGALILQFPLTQIRNSIVTLSVQADNLRFTINASPGEVVSAQVCKFANVTCGGFEALTDVGYLTVEVKNTGYIDADYTATVSNCSAGVLDMGAQKVALQAGQSERLPSFIVKMSSDAQQDDLFCWVGLRDSLGALTDTKEVNFYVNQTAYDEKTSQPDFKEGNGVGGAPRDLDCSDYCPNILDLPCFLVKRCWSRLLLLFGLILLIVAAGSLCLTAIRRGWCVKIFVCWGKLVFSKDSKKKNNKGSSKRKKKSFRESMAVKMMSKMMEESFGNKGGIERVQTAQTQGFAMQAMNPLSTSIQPNQRTQASSEVAAGNEMVYLALSPLGRPPWLFSPGPSCCLIGNLQVIQSMPGLPPDYIFTVPEHHALQRVAFNPETGNYQNLPQAMCFDPDMVTLVLDGTTVHQMISTSPRGACLN